jgi:endoglucanase
MRSNIFTFLFVLFALNFTKAQSLSTVFEINKALGRGINMGNIFEAPSETEWGNPFRDDYFQRISSLGFNHVRIPVRWDMPTRASQSSPYTINSSFFLRIKSVVDNALANNLYVVLNMHHHYGIFEAPLAEKEKFLAQWSQIAEYFKNYDKRLLFEVMNEPHDKLTPALWNTFFNDALAEIRKTNPNRAVVMGLANYGGLGGLPELKVPNDKNIIVTVHYYNPFNFTHQGADWIGTDAKGWLGTKWEDLEVERNQIIAEFEPLIAFSKEKNIPIHIGEFGAYSKADLESRTKWTTFLARWFESKGFSWAYWEWSAGFGIFNPGDNTINTKLADALLKNTLPEAKKQTTKLLYQSNFNTGLDGWNLGVQPGSEATAASENETVKVDVKTSVKDTWHVQLTKNNLVINNKKRYLVTVKASASIPASVTCYVAKASAPYNSYSGFPSFGLSTTEKEFSYTFLMNDPSDPVARISFDMGGSISKISISSVKIEEVLDAAVTETVLANEAEINESIKISPNPAIDRVSIEHDKKIDRIELFSNQGKLLNVKQNNNATSTQINLTGLPTGQYFINLYINNFRVTRKLIKN